MITIIIVLKIIFAMIAIIINNDYNDNKYMNNDN